MVNDGQTVDRQNAIPVTVREIEMVAAIQYCNTRVLQ